MAKVRRERGTGRDRDSEIATEKIVKAAELSCSTFSCLVAVFSTVNANKYVNKIFAISNL